MSTTEANKEAYVQDETAAVNGTGPAGKRTFGQKMKRHCARFWWLWFIVFAIVVLVIVLPIVYVGYPNKAQSAINKAKLEPQSMALLNPAPDSFDLQLDNMFISHSGMSAHLDKFTGDLRLPDSDKAFCRINVPSITAANGSIAHIEQRVQIADHDQFNEYAKTVLLSDEYSIYLKGKGGFKYGSLPKTNVKYNKKITMKGLNSLKGLTVSDFTILTTSQPDGANANGTVMIPNPSVATYQLGDVGLTMSVDGLPVGNSTLKSVLLKPGNNTFTMRATTNQTAVVGLIFTNYKSGILPIDIVGNSSVYDGQHLEYYEKALSSNKVQIKLDVIKALDEAGLAGLLGINTTSSSSSSTSSASSSATSS
ncbi:hypothetical protein HRR83_006394 [Exophiala dermatitidis]|uniref:Uncharacterized protein n=2 Tax=Exophiala dermatitidis TaxID=5970 RepID=H6CA72_EXODN|nr:uncharacterized protein HMPREF1120_08009 [Exophiala dermatitidis NIH/UT8656]KAJ4507405.1 hypothetical protein HRR75_006754 [Exophiala dermatitidis]EHY60036.1 hypothetical protein HMPREF1120_08009 [Exophiala dermatitidis NIH/UT8656]KAJ4509398.1 hypothetical protein HRR73_007252 [Exophiala dermatitidis]KAJ4509585.1 hypothetical protein HRR74_007366 [Exophiala dermatitidis]KAJ4530591.1 hypothetical protein HRR76_008293 [Exophiala dermatitidis]